MFGTRTRRAALEQTQQKTARMSLTGMMGALASFVCGSVAQARMLDPSRKCWESEASPLRVRVFLLHLHWQPEEPEVHSD